MDRWVDGLDWIGLESGRRDFFVCRAGGGGGVGLELGDFVGGGWDVGRWDGMGL